MINIELECRKIVKLKVAREKTLPCFKDFYRVAHLKSAPSAKNSFTILSDNNVL